MEEKSETSEVPKVKQSSATIVKLSLATLTKITKTMEEVKGAMKAAITTQISIVGTTMETVMAADMIQKTVETIRDPVTVLEMSQFKTQSVQLRMWENLTKVFKQNE